MNTRVLLPLLLLSCLVRPVASLAQWVTDGTGVATLAGDQISPVLASDGAGGVIIVWHDRRSTTSNDIYAQRINASGGILWTTNGVPVTTGPNEELNPAIASDGAGGAIIAWQNYQGVAGNDLYAQRIDASGAVLWMTRAGVGVALCTATGDQGSIRMIPDGVGGAIVTWFDGRVDIADIYAQRIDGFGVVQWTTDGVPVCATTGVQNFPEMIADDSGGAIIAWQDSRSGTSDIYAQRINESGAIQWQSSAVPLCTAADLQLVPALASDGSGGAIVTWEDRRNGVDYDVYAQRVNASGAVQWAANGVAVSATTNTQFAPRIVSDGTTGAIVTWFDDRDGNYDIYAQRINVSGAVQWTANGVALCTAANSQSSPLIVEDGNGGAIAAWRDGRNGTDDVYAQRVDASGATQWADDGVALSTAAFNQRPNAIISDGAGGAVVAWQDHRNGADYDVYALRVNPDGALPTGVHDTPSASTIALSANYPNPFSGATTIDLTLRDAEPVRVEVFDVAGRRVRAIVVGRLQAGESRLVFDGMDDAAHALPSGVYFYRVHAGSETVTRKMVIDR